MHLIHGLPGEAGGNDSSAVQGVYVVKKRGLLCGCSSPAWSSLLFAWDSSSLVAGSLWEGWWGSQLSEGGVGDPRAVFQGSSAFFNEWV